MTLLLHQVQAEVQRVFGNRYRIETTIADSRMGVSVRIMRLGDYGIEAPAVTVYGRMQRDGTWRATVGADHASYHSMTPELSQMILHGNEIAGIMGRIGRG